MNQILFVNSKKIQWINGIFGLLYFSRERRYALLFLITSQFSFTTLFSQAPTKQWDARFGGNSVDLCYTIQQTIDGGYIIGGQSLSDSSGDKTQTCLGLYDSWAAKCDSNGIKQWDVRYGGNQGDDLHSVKQTIEGGYIFAGESASDSGEYKSQDSHGSYDYWIIKTDSSGQKLWDLGFGGIANDKFQALQLTSDSGFILAGYSNSGIDGDKTQPCQGEYDYWIVKTDVNGVKQWDATFGGSEDDELESIEQTTDGGYIMGGSSTSDSSGDKSQSSQGSSDYWIVKTDANGIKQWDATFGGIALDMAYSVIQTSEGGYLLGGVSASGISGDKSQESQGGLDFWIVKTDSAGVKLWDFRFGGNDDDQLNALEQTTDGGYILGGWSFSGLSGDKSQASQGGYDYWIVKINGDGQKEWDARFGGAYDDRLLCLQQTDDDYYVLGGSSRSPISGDKTQSSQGQEDYWIVKLGATIIDTSCNAEFIIIPDSTQTGLYYGYNLSTGSNLMYTWNWGDGTTSTGQLPSHTYSDSGFYQICLMIYDTITACQDTFCANYQILKPSDLLNIHEVIFVEFPVGITAIEKVSWSVFPNPAEDVFKVDEGSSQIAELRILDIYGRNLKSIKEYDGREISINEFSSQTFIVQVLINNNWYSKLLIKQ